MFGFPDDFYWEVLLKHFSVSKPDGPDTCGVQLYGDECTIYEGVSYMALHWTPDLCPLHKDATCSRYLICLLPVASYLVEETGSGKTNVTLQHAMLHIVNSMNTWRVQGVAGLKAAVVGIRGDGKFIVQLCNSRRSSSRDQVCVLCGATKSLLRPMTDISDSAAWRHFMAPMPWLDEPWALSSLLPHMNLHLLGLDGMHLFHLGVGRDLCGSVLVYLRRRRAFRGRNVSKVYVGMFSLVDCSYM